MRAHEHTDIHSPPPLLRPMLVKLTQSAKRDTGQVCFLFIFLKEHHIESQFLCPIQSVSADGLLVAVCCIKSSTSYQ